MKQQDWYPEIVVTSYPYNDLDILARSFDQDVWSHAFGLIWFLPYVEGQTDVLSQTFQWFWDTTNAANGLVPDRWPDVNFSSIAAIGFGLTAYGVGAERGYVTRQQARDRTLTTLRFLWNAPHHGEAAGA